MPCRINKKRKWTGRLLMEAAQHKHSSFITLTYKDDPGRDLIPSDLTLFWKRLRHKVPNLRYFAVGEYGEKRGRPHYHAVLFGYQTKWVFGPKGEYYDPLITKEWGLGNTQSGEFNSSRASYMAGYVTKKMTTPDARGLNGRTPEFFRCSREPPIGAAYLLRILQTAAGQKALAETQRIPYTIRTENHELPLDYYTRSWVAKQLGIKIGNLSEEELLDATEGVLTWGSKAWQQECSKIDRLMSKAFTRRIQNGSPF